MTNWIDWGRAANEVNLSAPMLEGTLEANVGLPGPRGLTGDMGPVGPGADTVLVRAGSMRAALPAQRAIKTNTFRVVATGDSKTEGTGMHVVASRWLNQTATLLRGRYPIAGGDAGVGYIPCVYFDAWQSMDLKPTLAGTGNFTIGYEGGPGNRAVQLGVSGTVTYPAISCRYLTVHYTQSPAPYAGTFEVVVDGVVKQTIDTTNALLAEKRGARIDMGTVANRVVVLRRTVGDPRIGGVLFQTGIVGITVEDHSHSGFATRDIVPQPGGAYPAQHVRFWESVTLAQPKVMICALGANDMSSLTPEVWGDNLRWIVDKFKSIAGPDSGFVLVISAQGTNDVNTAPNKLTLFEAAARKAIGDDPQTSILYESSLWSPRPNTDYGYGGPEGWLADTVHTSALGHQRIAEMLVEFFTNKMPQTGAAGPSGASTTAQITDASVLGRDIAKAALPADVRTLIGAAPTTHASQHSAGGTDPITPASIKAADLYATSRTSTAEDVNTFTNPGTYLLVSSAINLPAAVTGYLEVIRRNGTVILQRYSVASGSTDGRQWIRGSSDGATWTQWRATGPTQAVEVNAVPLTRLDAVDADASIASGSYRTIRANVTNIASFPAEWTSSVGYLTSWGYSSDAYVSQTFVSQHGDQVWSRAKYGTWGPWKRLVTDDDPRFRDTGWRSLDLLNGWAATGATPNINPAVRRIGNIVYVRLRSLDGSAATSNTFAKVPTGFIPPSADGGIGFMGSTPRVVSAFTSGDLMVSGGMGQPGVGSATSISYITQEAWPTTLPGTAA